MAGGKKGERANRGLPVGEAPGRDALFLDSPGDPIDHRHPGGVVEPQGLAVGIEVEGKVPAAGHVVSRESHESPGSDKAQVREGKLVDPADRVIVGETQIAQFHGLSGGVEQFDKVLPPGRRIGKPLVETKTGDQAERSGSGIGGLPGRRDKQPPTPGVGGAADTLAHGLRTKDDAIDFPSGFIEQVSRPPERGKRDPGVQVPGIEGGRPRPVTGYCQMTVTRNTQPVRKVPAWPVALADRQGEPVQ